MTPEDEVDDGADEGYGVNGLCTHGKGGGNAKAMANRYKGDRSDDLILILILISASITSNSNNKYLLPKPINQSVWPDHPSSTSLPPRPARFVSLLSPLPLLSPHPSPAVLTWPAPHRTPTDIRTALPRTSRLIDASRR